VSGTVEQVLPRATPVEFLQSSGTFVAAVSDEPAMESRMSGASAVSHVNTNPADEGELLPADQTESSNQQQATADPFADNSFVV
jgi:hypothetical protein